MKRFKVRDRRLKSKAFKAGFIGLIIFSFLLLTGNVFAREIDPNLKLLPENNRYFQYRGLPFISFTARGDKYTSIPVVGTTSPADIESMAEYANHFYIKEAESSRISFEGLRNLLNDSSHFNQLESIVKTAYEKDVIMSILFWSYLWNFSTQTFGDGSNNNVSWKSSDMVRSINDPFLTEDLGKYPGTGPYGPYGLPGVTRMDLHQQSVDQVVKSTWDYPNVTYSFMWEYNWRAYVEDGNYLGETPGSFHRWWVDYFKTQGQVHNQDVTHLFSNSFGAEHPQKREADFIVNESRNAFRWRGGSGVSDEFDVSGVGIPLVQSYGIPMVSWSTDDLRTNHGTIPETESPTPDQIRDLLVEGHHPAVTFRGLSAETKNYFLQSRWYVENNLTWEDEPGFRGGDEINSANLPIYKYSSRPVLSNAPGYNKGAIRRGIGIDFAVVYRDSDGDAPAKHLNRREQAEVWVDMNEDGRFDPDISAGERFLMEASGTDYSSGVTYTLKDVLPDNTTGGAISYVFRFADKNWYPPENNEMFPSHYSNLVVDEVVILPRSCYELCTYDPCDAHDDCSLVGGCKVVEWRGYTISGVCCSGSCILPDGQEPILLGGLPTEPECSGGCYHAPCSEFENCSEGSECAVGHCCIGACTDPGIASTPTLTPTPTPTPIVLPPGCELSSSSWQNFPLPTQSGTFSAGFDVIPNDSNPDGLTSFSQSSGGDYTDYAATIRLKDGVIDIRNGNTYGATNLVNYTPGTSYHFRTQINVPARTYSVWVTPQGQSEITLATNYQFRDSQANTTSIQNWGLWAGSGSHTVCDLTLGTTATPTPSVSLLQLLASWLTSTLDQNGDGKVNGVDLGLVLR